MKSLLCPFCFARGKNRASQDPVTNSFDGLTISQAISQQNQYQENRDEDLSRRIDNPLTDDQSSSQDESNGGVQWSPFDDIPAMQNTDDAPAISNRRSGGVDHQQPNEHNDTVDAPRAAHQNVNTQEQSRLSYDIISVREPLAKVLADRQQQLQQNNNRNNLGEHEYSEVYNERGSSCLYEEIACSTTSSVTYDRIDNGPSHNYQRPGAVTSSNAALRDTTRNLADSNKGGSQRNESQPTGSDASKTNEDETNRNEGPIYSVIDKARKSQKSSNRTERKSESKLACVEQDNDREDCSSSSSNNSAYEKLNEACDAGISNSQSRPLPEPNRRDSSPSSDNNNNRSTGDAKEENVYEYLRSQSDENLIDVGYEMIKDHYITSNDSGGYESLRPSAGAQQADATSHNTNEPKYEAINPIATEESGGEKKEQASS